MEKIQINQKAPAFTLPDQNGNIQKLSDYGGATVILYFYPKDDTPGCTKEACSLRDTYSEIQEAGAIVLGISKDSVESHKAFHEKYHLSFDILSDESTETIQAYDSQKESGGTSRNTFLINPEGNIAKIYENVKPDQHADEILTDLKAQNEIN